MPGDIDDAGSAAASSSTPAGAVLTALHVVDGAAPIQVTFADGTEAGGQVAGEPAGQRHRRARRRPAARGRRARGAGRRRRRSATPSSPSATRSGLQRSLDRGRGLGLRPRRSAPRRGRTLDGPHPVRRRRQPGQLRRPAAQPGRAGGRHRHRAWPTRPSRTSSSASASPCRSPPPAAAAGGPTAVSASATDGEPWSRTAHDADAASTRWSRRCTRSRRRSSARTCCSSGCSSRCWPAATCSSRACPGWPRRWRSRRWRRRSAASSSASSSPPTWCPPTSSAPASTTSATGEFQVSLGPVFTNLLLADEINRAPAKVQSALLEVMQERQVTIGRETYPAPDPFLVMATQNPIESEGTYPLPEAQVDRFMLKVLVGYPTADRGVRRRRADDHARRSRPTQVIDPEHAAASSSGRPTRSTSTRSSSSTPCGWPPRPATSAAVGLPDLARYVVLRRQPAGVDQPGPRRPRRWPSCAAATTRCPRDVTRPRPRRAAAPARAVLRGARRRRRPPTTCSARSSPPIAAARGRRPDVRAPAVVTDGRRHGPTPQPLTPERLLRRLEWRVHPPPRRAAAGRLPHAVPRHRHRLRRPARVPARRRPAPHRLERHRPHGRAVRARVPRGPRGHRVAAARPLGVDGLRPGRAAQGRRARRGRRDAGAAAGPRRQPGRRAALRRAACGRRSRPGTGATRCCGSSPGTAAAADRAPPAEPGTTDLAAAAARRARDRRAAGRCVVIVSDFISAAGLGAAAGLLAHRHDVVAIQVVDRREFELPDGRDDRRRGRRDRRADLRRHQRPGVPAAAARRGRRAAGRPASAACASAGHRPVHRSPPTRTSCAPWSASPSCAGGGGR